MTVALIDIVVPIWNRPNETRNCLVSLLNYTSDARFIMVDSGSERDTERLLQEFADGLEERALLMHDDTNIGFVRAANRGMARCDAPFVAVVKSTATVSPGWLEPLLEFASTHPAAGILLPRLTQGEPPCAGPIEVSSGSFAAMVITREAYRAVGGFDEGMDGGIWCLKDFTRRACAHGFLTYMIPASSVSYTAEVRLGSERRREETLRRSVALFKERWGEGKTFCIHVPKGLDLPVLKQKLEWLLKGARHGDSYYLLLPAVLFREAQHEGFECLHENIRLVQLPRFTSDSRKKKVYEKLAAEHPGMTCVSAVDGLPFPWSNEYLPFTDLSQRIAENVARF